MVNFDLRWLVLAGLAGCGQVVSSRAGTGGADDASAINDGATLTDALLADAAEACGPYFMRATIAEGGSPASTICRTLAPSDFLVSWRRSYSGGRFTPCRLSTVSGGSFAVGLNAGVGMRPDFFGGTPTPGRPPATVEVYSVTETAADATVYPTCAWVSERCELTRLSSTDPAPLIEARLASRCVLNYYPEHSRPGATCAPSVALEALHFRVRPGRENFIFSGIDASAPSEVPSCL